MPFTLFLDRDNYLNYADYPLIILARYAALGPVPVLANEPVWLLFNAALGLLFDPEVIVRLTIFLGAFFLSYRLLCADARNGFWLMLFLSAVRARGLTVHGKERGRGFPRPLGWR